MEKFEIDNEFLNKICDSTEGLIKEVQKDIERVRNENEDNFIRFMAYLRISALKDLVNFGMDFMKGSVCEGSMISNEIFNTKQRDKNGWTHPDPRHSDFFKNEEEEKSNEKNSLDEFKKFLVESLIKQMKIRTH